MNNMRPLMKIRSGMVVVGFLFWVGMMVWGQPVIGEDLQALKAGVVKITTKTGQVGTGFIVRIEPEMVYIITAAHVIAGDLQPTIEFFSRDLMPGGQVPAKGSVLPGAQVNDDLRGLAVVIVRGKEQRPHDVSGVIFESSTQVVSGGEQALLIGHPGGGGDWAVVKRDISNRIIHDITLDPAVAPRFSGGPIFVNNKVVGMVMSNMGDFGLGITHKSLLNYLDGIGVEPRSAIDSVNGGFGSDGDAKTTPPPTALPKTKTVKDGAPMVLVSAGEFTMGALDDDQLAGTEERPAHQVYLDAFSIDQYEVTTSRYAKFFQGTRRNPPEFWSEKVLQQHGNKPVVGVTWDDAKAYCEWAGKRLPTEAEWEKAARGTDQRLYPWGNDPPHEKLANFNQCCDFKKYGVLTDVGSFEGGQSPYGADDMAGNVWEWVEDWYDGNLYTNRATAEGPVQNPRGPETGASRVLRGGSWNWDTRYLRSSNRFRDIPTFGIIDFGFRCAQDAP